MTGSEQAVEMALEMIKRYEGLRLEAYRDAAGIWTIGYGHTGPVDGKPLGPGVRISREEAEQLLRGAVVSLARRIQDKLQRPAAPHELAAMVSLAYNIGFGAFTASSLFRAWQKGDKQAAAREFGRWVYAGGRILPGLVRRRLDEALIFCGVGA